MRSISLALFAAFALAACDTTDAVVDQAKVDARMIPVRGDTMVAVGFRPGTAQPDPGQLKELNGMVAAGRAAQRDEFVVVTDGSGGPIQQARAQQIMRTLTNAGAHWVGTSVEPAMAMGPDRVVVVRSEYRLGERNCPDYTPAGIANNNEATMPGFGCATAYNLGQMLARTRDAAVGRDPGPADATVNAAAVQRYREGRVRTLTPTSSSGSSGTGGTGSGGGGMSGTASSGGLSTGGSGTQTY